MGNSRILAQLQPKNNKVLFLVLHLTTMEVCTQKHLNNSNTWWLHLKIQSEVWVTIRQISLLFSKMLIGNRLVTNLYKQWNGWFKWVELVDLSMSVPTMNPNQIKLEQLLLLVKCKTNLKKHSISNKTKWDRVRWL